MNNPFLMETDFFSAMIFAGLRKTIYSYNAIGGFRLSSTKWCVQIELDTQARFPYLPSQKKASSYQVKKVVFYTTQMEVISESSFYS
jgi:hypothetical protein